jgi:hypothetical protein
MPKYHQEKLLILTKTYPSPSRKYREISCIAALNEHGELRRLFPIPHRLLDGDLQFERWEWIQANISKANNDHRPESYRLDTDSINRISKVGTGAGWAERYQWIVPHIVDRFEALEIRRQSSGETLGFIRPKDFELIITPTDNPNWTDEEKATLIQDGLFDTPEVKSRIPLRKLPYDFHYHYECQIESNDSKHKHKIIDWEAGALYWKCQKRYGDDWEKYFRQKLEMEFSQTKELLFLMGTMHRFPDQWLIVGLIYPPKVEARQRSLLLSAPGV